MGANVEIMTPEHHDLVLAITSHVPHLIAYNIVGTAADLEEVTQSEVIKFSAGGFRDFTRIAASDPTMWRDVFLHNKEAVLEMLGRFNEDLSALQRAIRWGDGDALFDLFTRTRAIRRGIIARARKRRSRISGGPKAGRGEDGERLDHAGHRDREPGTAPHHRDGLADTRGDRVGDRLRQGWGIFALTDHHRGERHAMGAQGLDGGEGMADGSEIAARNEESRHSKPFQPVETGGIRRDRAHQAADALDEDDPLTHTLILRCEAQPSLGGTRQKARRLPEPSFEAAARHRRMRG